MSSVVETKSCAMYRLALMFHALGCKHCLLKVQIAANWLLPYSLFWILYFCMHAFVKRRNNFFLSGSERDQRHKCHWVSRSDKMLSGHGVGLDSMRIPTDRGSVLHLVTRHIATQLHSTHVAKCHENGDRPICLALYSLEHCLI